MDSPATDKNSIISSMNRVNIIMSELYVSVLLKAR